MAKQINRSHPGPSAGERDTGSWNTVMCSGGVGLGLWTGWPENNNVRIDPNYYLWVSNAPYKTGGLGKSTSRVSALERHGSATPDIDKGLG